MEVVMKAKMKSAIALWAPTLAVCLLFCTAARAQGMPCTGQPNEPISYGNIITCSIAAPGDSQTFVFNGTTGERIEVAISSPSNFPCIQLVGVTTACGAGERNWIDTVLTQTRQYTILTYDYYASGTLNYTLALQRAVPPSPSATQITYGNNLPGQINPYGDLAPYFFTASVGDIVDVTVVSGSNFPCIVLYAPDGTTTWNACGAGERNVITTNPLTLAGNYTILVYDYYPSGALSYNLDLECLGGPCVVTPIPDVSGYISLQGAPLANRGVTLIQPGEHLKFTMTDNNGYYQFLHAVAGKTFNVMIAGPPVPAELRNPDSADAAPADTVDKGPLK
jgi:hypothetical protein